MEWFLNNILNIGLIIVGCAAIFVYLWQKYDEKKKAATILVLQIIEIKQNLLQVKEVLASTNFVNNNPSVHYNLLPVFSISQWDNYKHLFSKTLHFHDYSEIDTYFTLVSEIKKAQETIKSYVKKSHEISLEKSAEIEKEKLNGNNNSNTNATDFSSIFQPSFYVPVNIPYDYITNIQKLLDKAIYLNIETNQGFIKLKKISKVFKI